MLYTTIQHKWMRPILAVLGCFIYAIGINYFITPSGLYTGGFLGAAQIIRTLLVQHLGLSFGRIDIAGILFFCMNIPLYLLAFHSIGKRFGLRSLLCTASMTLFLSILVPPVTPLLEETLTNAIVGGIIAGAGVGLMLLDGGSSGGTDILGLYWIKRHSRFSVGKANLFFNGMIYALCFLLFNPQVAIYSIVYAVFSALIVDRLHQQNISVMAWVFSKNEDAKLRDFVTERLGRSMTYWRGTGAYTEKDTQIMCVCLSKFELEELRHALLEIDPTAFLVVEEGVRISGNYQKKI